VKDHSGKVLPYKNVLFAPWRRSYIKDAHKDKPGVCAFCDALKAGKRLESLIVHVGSTCSVILNKYPYNAGHTLVIPNRHTADFVSLTPEEFADLHELVKKVLGALQTAYHPQGVNIGMNLGRSGGAGITEHLHYHLVPRWKGDTNFMAIVGQTKVISESLEETYGKLVTLLL